jgi:hypothetical protein
MREPFYRTTYSRHLYSLVINGFYERDLDADDHEFLEYVRQRGSANGSLPSSGVVLLEELEFWHLPYATAPRIERRVGKKPRTLETAEQRAMRAARSSVWHARRVIRANEKAIAAAELERERREWEKANENRKARELLSDAEWDAAAPRKASFGKTVGRHHVPQWKLDEAKEEQAKAERRIRRRQKREAEETRLIEEAERLRAWAEEQAQERRRREIEIIEAAQQREATYLQEQERKRRQAIIDEARATVQRVNQQEREWQQQVAASLYRNNADLKQAVLTLTKNSHPYVWTVDEMVRSLGCSPVKLNICLDEMVRDGQLGKTAA